MSSPLIVVGWNGLPAYGSKLIQAGRDHLGVQFPVLGTRPDVPTEGMEDVLGEGLIWLNAGRRYSWKELSLPVPDLFIHTGWKYPHFISLADEVRANGGKIVGMFDNCWKLTPRQFIGSIYFRIFLRRKYFAAWVPGKSGKRLANQLGFGVKRVFVGMYGSSSEVFSNKVPMSKRKKQILFVGRLINRKGILELVEAFRQLSGQFSEWDLLLVGDGDLKQQISLSDKIKVMPFQQPSKVAELMNESRIFALASREEHWGLVVHEASLCGCALLIQQQIGAAFDLAQQGNAVVFKKTNISLIKEAFLKILNWSELEYENANTASVGLASHFGPDVWARALEDIIKRAYE